MTRGLYTKLAFTNIKNNKRFYFPYLLTGILTIAMFYIMCALAENEGIGKMPGSRDVDMILHLGMGVIGIFSVVFLFYTNSFIIKRRKKELGIYNILGMEKYHISKILAAETCFTAVIAIAGGLITGIVFNKLMCMLLYKLMGFSAGIDFYVSGKGIRLSILLFLGIYFLTLIHDLLQLKLSNPIELLRGGNTGEREPKTKILMSILGVISLGAGYFIAITTENPISALTLFFVAVVLVIAGTYFLFTAGSIAFLKMLRKKKSYYYKTRHFTAVSGMLYRMKQNAVGLSNICILSTMVLVVVSSTVCLYLGINDMLKERFPADITVSVRYTGEVVEDNNILPVVESAVKENGRKVRGELSYTELTFTTVQQDEKYIMDRKKLQSEVTMSDLVGFTVITREDCRELYQEEFPELADNEIGLINIKKEEQKEQLLLNDQAYDVKESKIFKENDDTTSMLNVMENYHYIIVNDMDDLERIYKTQAEAYMEDASPITQYYRIDLDGTEEEKKACFRNIENHLAQIENSFSGSIYSECRQEWKENFHAMYGGFFFLGLFLGMMFLMITVLIIFYKQISEGYEDRERFAIMEKVGMSNTEVKATIRSQVRTVFLLPIVMAAIHIAAAFPMIERLLQLFGLKNTPLFVLCMAGTILVFILIYLLVFLRTSRVYYKIVGEQI
ncbi:MAG: ABC transporter permease [Lachnospiraceae bacterium]|nr:ABC transporter permease [Lachnospiraceae bacterium]